MKIIRNIFVVVTAIILFNACSTDFEINGEYKETAVVYSILDPTQQDQYIRINRAFLGEGNALVFAQIPDSTLYPYLMEVKIFAENEYGQVVYESPVADTIMVYKESELFFTGYQPIYRIRIQNPAVISYSDTLWLNPDYKYRLQIINPVTGNIIESTTPIIAPFDISQPSPYSDYISFSQDLTKNIEWKSAVNGKRYEAKFIFTYYEVFDSNTLDTITKTMEWGIGSTVANLLTGGEDLLLSYSSHDFYFLLSSKLEVRNDVQRYPGSVKLIMSVGTDELNTYINVNTSSNSIIQERPQFTNISNGVGLFSSKFLVEKPYRLNQFSLDTLMYGGYTNNLNFHTYINN